MLSLFTGNMVGYINNLKLRFTHTHEPISVVSLQKYILFLYASSYQRESEM